MKEIKIKPEFISCSKVTITNDEIRVKFHEDDRNYKTQLIEFACNLDSVIKDFPYTFRAYVRQENGVFRIKSFVNKKTFIKEYYKDHYIKKLQYLWPQDKV